MRQSARHHRRRLVSLDSRQQTNRWNNFDGATTWDYFAIQAQHHGLITHAMGGFDVDKAREMLKLPDTFDLHGVVALDIVAPKKVLPENF